MHELASKQKQQWTVKTEQEAKRNATGTYYIKLKNPTIKLNDEIKKIGQSKKNQGSFENYQFAQCGNAFWKKTIPFI